MRYFITISLVLLLLSCTNENNEFNSKKVDELTIKDAKPFLGELYSIKFKNRNHFFTYDNRANVKMFENYRSKGLVGKSGKGPCEHGSLNNLAIYQDSLFMIDREQGKYLVHGITENTKTQCREIVDDLFIRLSGVEVVNGKPFFIRSSLVKSSEPDVPIVYTFDEKNDEIIPRSITLRDLDINLMTIPMRLSMASDKKDNVVYFYLPLTKKIFAYNVLKDKMKAIAIDVYLAEDENIYDTEDLQKFSNLLSNQVEVVFDLFALDNSVAIGYRIGTGKDQVWGIKMYDYKGNKIAESKYDNRVVYMDNKELMTLNLNTKKQQNPYSFKVYEYGFE